MRQSNWEKEELNNRGKEIMNVMSQLKRVCGFLLHANVMKTIIFNFRMLPREQAIRLPIWLYGRIHIGERMGGVKLHSLRQGSRTLVVGK